VRRFAEEEHSTEIASMTDALQVLVDQTVNRVAKLRSTITGQRLTLQYQPIVSIADRSLHHFEALARFPDAAAGPTIAFAESVGLVQDVDLMVAQKAIDELLAPTAKPDLRIAVNMSAASLGSDIFVAAFRKLVNHYGSVAPRLLIEVTESSTITDLERAARILSDLRARGQVICLDDFGAGAASFPYLQALPVDFVKIDGSYIKRLGQSRRDDAILRGMVGLSRDIGVKTIAEMVETVEQANQILALGIDFGQGYLFGRPENTPAYAPAGPIAFGKRRGARETWG
jgi:EAL domain-containing protein (putative c-di-GMP-specific phosphodiesterase class I)